LAGSHSITITSLAAVLLVAACGDSSREAAPGDDSGPPPAAVAHDTIEIRMVTDEAGNYYDPAEVTAGPGDVLRLVLVSGVHNFHIPGETNPGADDLPEPGPLLQLPGQTWDWSVDLDPGEYAFQCDPHAALGMIGTLSVTN
jgi:plastocyanin